MLGSIKQMFSKSVVGLLITGCALATPTLTAHAATTNTFGFNTTTLNSGDGPVDPANGVTAISGTSLAVGDVVVFDGLVINVPGAGSSDAWGAVELNSNGGVSGVTAATLGVLARTGSANPCSLWINGSSFGNFASSSGIRTNRVRIELTATTAGSTANMNWLVKIDQGLTGAFTTSLSGTGVNFANNIIRLTFGDRNFSHQFVNNSVNTTFPYLTPVITTQPASQTLDQSVAARFTVVAANSPTRYQWQAGAVGSGIFTNLNNGGQFSGATNATLNIASLTTANAADYRVIVGNSAGSVTSTPPATLTVLAVTPLYAWSVPVTITTADATLSQTGTVVGAAVFGGVEKAVTLTSGAVIDFKADGSVATVTGQGTFTTAYSGDTGNANFNTVLAEANYDGGPKTITLNNLTVGKPYSVQLFAVDTRNGSNARHANYQDPNDANDISPTFLMGDTAYVIGTFTATASTMTITENLTDGGGGNMNALVIRDLTSVVAPQITTQPQSPGTLDSGLITQFKVTATGTAPLRYQWQAGAVGSGVFTNLSNGGRFSGATNAILTITGLTANDTADYQVIVTNTASSVTSTPPATLNVNVLSGSPLYVWSPPAPITTADATLSQTGTVVGAAVFGGAETAVTLTSGAVIDFKADGSVATATGQGTFTTAYSGDTGNANFNTVLAGANYDGGPKTITLNNLTVSQQYAVQLFAVDTRGGSNTRHANYQDPNDPYDISATFQMGDTVYVIGTFTATNSTMNIQENLTDGGGGNMNALVLRRISGVVAPQIVSQPQSVFTSPGQTAQLSVIAYGSSPLSYIWQKSSVGGVLFTNLANGGTLSGATNSTLTMASLAAGDTGDYRVIVSNSGGSVTSTPPATVTVHSTPGIVPFNFNDVVTPNSGTANPSPTVAISGSLLLVGDTVVFDGIVSTNSALTGSGDGWGAVNLAAGGFQGVTGAKIGVLVRLGAGPGQLFINGSGSSNPTAAGAPVNRVRIELYPSAAGSTTNMGWSVAIDQNLTGTFQPAVTGTNLTFVNNTIPLSFGANAIVTKITQNPQSPVSIYSGPTPASQIVGVGSPATVGVTVKGWSPTFQWRKNGGTIGNATNRNYTLPSATLGDNGAQFTVVVSNRLNSANVITSGVATVTVQIPNNFTWYPTADLTTWNTATANWTTNGGTGQTLFASGNNVTFDALGYNLGGSTVTANTSVNPNAVTVSATAGEQYVFTGSGGINGQSLFLTGDGTGALGLQTVASFTSATIDTNSALQVGYGGVNGSIQADNITNNGTIDFQNATGTLLIPGRLTGSGGIIQDGAGTTILTATNSSYRVNAINAGALVVASAPNPGIITNNAEFRPDGAVDLVIGNSFTGLGHFYFTGFQKTTLTGVSTQTGVNLLYWSQVTVDNPQALGDVTSGSSICSGQDRFGGLYLSNNISWTQPLILQTRFAPPAASGTAPHVGNASGNNSIDGSLTFNTGGGSELNVDATTGTLTINSTVVNNAANNNNLNLQGAATGIWNGALSDSTGGTLNILKRGTGTWLLNGANTYTGPTTVSNGTLVINGQVGPGDVSVKSGATLGGNGVISGVVNIAAGGTIAPGTGIGTLAINNTLTLLPGSSSSFDINKTAGTNDQIIGLTSVTFGGTLAINNLSGTLTTSDSFKLFSSASYGGTFASITPATPGAGLIWSNTLAIDGTLRIMAGTVVATNPTNITATVVGGNTLQLAWPADHTGWTLEAQTNSLSTGLGTNWVRIASSTTTNQVSVPIVPANGSVFYRLVYP